MIKTKNSYKRIFIFCLIVALVTGTFQSYELMAARVPVTMMKYKAIYE